MTQPSVSTVETTPYLRMRAELPSQPEYDQQSVSGINQMPLVNTSPRLAQISVTSAYLGGTPATWQIEVPDLTTAGFDSDWGPRSGAQTTWTVYAHGFDGDMGMLAPTDGPEVRSAIRAGTTTPSRR